MLVTAARSGTKADVDLEKVALCNCTDCQTLSGSAFRVNVFVDETNLRFLSGEATEYVKTGESGNKRVQAFCRQLRHGSLRHQRR